MMCTYFLRKSKFQIKSEEERAVSHRADKKGKQSRNCRSAILHFDNSITHTNATPLLVDVDCEHIFFLI
jgi:hypothetical protein